ncbi:Stk1 family PASTA domain-containing Ser/Thr kinase [Jeotgalibacillus aurantiacus]|uniref:Stk1 family PASTA domain-containing Ser/Thr kinase n=1 Tax=Jeotgalibacillus aurantiacus TaxID=2763266 RepID=UPI001D09BAB5|nr:Stk1 family PASTA domain-containing Ser/Thr kinase [Jeotgalibacillus aurantiacus]
MIGKRLNDRYKIIRTIGSGGMANVYLAHDMILNRDVAVKMLRLDYVGDGDMLKRFQREAQSATSLAHPNIVSMYDVGDEDDYYYLVMEYVEGMTLKEYIKEFSPVSLDDAVKIMSQLTSAISHAHHNGIIHRDIKPQNILIDRDGTVKITDFGIAMALSATAMTQTNSVMGTVHYLSPEQARGGTASKKSDIYSLGIVMYEMITGRLPFEGESAISIALKHLQSELPHPSSYISNLPQSVENVILKSTAKDEFYRYRSADEMYDDLKTVLDISRENEPIFTVEPDLDATMAIPAIKNKLPLEEMQQTKPLEAQKTVVSPPVKEKEKKKRRKWPWITALVILFLLGTAGVMAAMGMFGPERIQVPDVVGEALEDAETIIEESGLTVGEITYESNDEVPEETVLRSSPKATRTLEEGEPVNLVVSSGKESVEVDGYIGRNFDNTEQLIREAGFENIVEEEEYNEAPAGTIIDQDPEEGEMVIPSETEFTVTISRGPQMAGVPDLTGLTEEELQAFEEESGLTVSVTREEYSDEIAAGGVISQNPEPGTELPIGGQVTVVVSRGAEPAPVNNVVVPVVIEYAQPEEPAEGEDPPEVPGDPEPQTITIYIADRDRTMDEPSEEFTITETVERTLRLVIEQGQTGSYRIERNGEVILEDSISYEENQ